MIQSIEGSAIPSTSTYKQHGILINHPRMMVVIFRLHCLFDHAGVLVGDFLLRTLRSFYMYSVANRWVVDTHWFFSRNPVASVLPNSVSKIFRE
jgi:hypothetical protein